MRKDLGQIISLCIAVLVGAGLQYYYSQRTVGIRMGEEIIKKLDNASNSDHSPSKTHGGLPNLLIIGDSISAGYYPIMKILLKGKVNVHRINENAKTSQYTLEKIGRWTDTEYKIDAILFNNGLHDLKIVDSNSDGDNPFPLKYAVPIDEYKNNMTGIIEKLKVTKAKLIFATTTPIPSKAKSRRPGSDLEYNGVAIKLMKENGIAICDLNTIASKLQSLMQSDGVHFNPFGSYILGACASSVVLEQLY